MSLQEDWASILLKKGEAALMEKDFSHLIGRQAKLSPMCLSQNSSPLAPFTEI